MSKTGKEPSNQEIYNKLAAELKSELAEHELLNQRKFSDDYYQNEVNLGANENDLAAHHDRFKKVISATDTRSLERIKVYHSYFFDKFRADGKYTYADKQAAWDMFIELDSRIATQQLKGGVLETALASLASLFTFHRQTAHTHGFNCRQYYQLVSEVLDKELRPFTAKWHSQLPALKESSKLEKSCRTELEDVQTKLSELKTSLSNICR
ncbi:hypothetical protein C9J12_14145 [Photobacterium frigidiphilum]|uniref:Uncharacterized protein n=1 Tax=Photobacterium frigidiphilum TaxID=264736 RepID=A0A2T3JFI2_9GAMM|nr:hypothetical protein [Photobacterium frigidiphilum]PSU47686.1 hypothetical protein C9J12_14145 [Photobacterium frigidiphilum]